MTYKKTYRHFLLLLLTMLLAGGNAMAQDRPLIGGSVYGGGNLADVGGSVTVNMRTGTVTNDVYGGGALANTNNYAPDEYDEVTVTVGVTVVTGYYTKSGDNYTEITTANQKAVSGTTYYKKGKWVDGATTYTTAVNLLGGTVKGNVYGGGLGRQYKAAVNEQPEVTAVAAMVHGNVTVTLDGTKLESHFTGEGDDRMADAGQIFGCNNLNGTPKGHVKVHVKRTVDSDKSSEAALALTRDQRTTYDVAAVYGGGNQANYEPVDAFLDPDVAGNPAKIAAAFAEVLIEGCNKTSIEYVYGGGNAAAVPATEVTVKGTYIIDYVFGGGNGKSTSTYTNPGADVGIIDKTTHAADPTTGNYGTGKAVTKLIGGKIHVVFGGSNTLGNVRGGTDVRMPQNDGTGDCCATLDVREIYGAGQNAEQEGGVNLILGCVEGLQNVYGGARNANIAGGINLTVTSGTFENVFGGNDVAGTIQGPITLNIEETACDPIIINNLYLGGNQAAYSIYGYYNDNGTLKPRTATDTEGAKPHVGNTAVPYANPVLNVISCTRIDNVFGGGYGATAVMYGSPTVNINMIPGDHAEKIKRSGTANAHDLGAIGNVFGGGNLAAVVGNTTVNIGQSEYVELISFNETDVRGYYTRTGSEGSYTYTLVEGNDAVAATPGTSYYKKVEGAYITGNVYGGGNQADVTGNTAVNVCAVNSDDPATTNIVEFTGVTISGTNFEGVTIKGAVFGAGKGVNTDITKALVSGNAIVGMAGGEVKKSVYGGGELSQVGGNTFVTVTGGTIGTSGQGGATYGNVYGGGLGSEANIRFGLIKGNTYVNICNIVADAAYHEAHTDVAVGTVLSSPTILHNIYGGGAYGSVGTFTYASEAADAVISGLQTANTGITNVTVTGGTIGTTGQNNGMVFGSSRGDVGAPNAIHDRLAWVYDTHVTIGTSGQGTDLANPTINGSVYGGGENGHNYNDAEVIVHSGTIGIHDGTAADATRGNVYGGGCGTDKYYSSSYTGTITNPTDGNGDTYNPLAGIVYGDATITMTGGLVNHNVYGAGAMGSVGTFTKDNADVITFTSGGTTTVAISGGTVGVDGDENGNVFGAARGDKTVTVKGLALVKETGVTISSTAIIKGSVYGGGEVGNVHTNTAVNVQGGTIAMNVFGGGKGVSDFFTCEHAMVGVNDEGACQDPDATTNQNKGTIVTISNGTIGTLNEGALEAGTGNVYGGGEIGRVEWNTQVKIGIGTGEGPFAPEIYGSVFGAGKGLETHGYSALVRGNSTVTIQGSAKVRHNVYGGGEKSTVGRYWVNGITATPCNDETQPTVPPGLPSGMPYHQRSGGICRVTVQGSAHIGPDAAADVSNNAGHVFGAGKGVEPHFNDGPQKMLNTNQLANFEADNERHKTAEEVYLEFLQTLALVTNSYVTIGGSATVMGSAYGGSESGFVQHNTEVTIESGTIGTEGTTTYGNVFGGGRGLEAFAEAGKVKGNTTVAINGGTMHGNVYGGGQLGDVGTINKADPNNYKWTNAIAEPYDYNNTGVCNVTISGASVIVKGDVFGAGKGLETTYQCEKAMAYKAIVAIENGTVNGDVYGGGQIGRVENDTQVTIGVANQASGASAPIIDGNVFGAGAGAETHGYSALVRGNAEVTVQGNAWVKQNVYGGGKVATVGRYWVSDVAEDPNDPAPEGMPAGMPYKTKAGGICTVSVLGYAKIGPDGAASETTGHVYGAGKGVNPHFDNTNADETQKSRRMDNNGDWEYFTREDEYLEFLQTLALATNTYVTINGDASVTSVKGSVYGGSENGFVQDHTSVTIQKGNIGAADSYGNIFGGGKGLATFAEAGRIGGGTTIAINGGTTYGNVYGGGELGIVKGGVLVNINDGEMKKDVYGGGALANTNTNNWDGATLSVTYQEVSGLIVGTSSVVGYYTESSGTYTEVTSGTAAANTKYYRKVNTTVNLLGGLINGDAYGGGLGQKDGFNGASGDIAALVYGDVSVNLGSEGGSSATAFNITHYTDDANTADYDESTVIKSGRVFGCNNLNGSPKGDVTVTVWNTVTGKLEGATNSRTPEAKKKLKKGDAGYVAHTYEVAAVYGGGNLANYTAAEGKKAYVRIKKCEVSIEEVYGGGNAAEVPATDVLVEGAYEIDEVFGGGNGNDPYTNGTTWITNPGANIGNTTQAGSTNTVLAGGLIHAAYGGSNKRGTIYGSVSIDIGTGGDCTLDLEKMVGAGKDADVNGDLIMVLGCKPGEKIPVVYGGADNAHVNGNVELTITSGNYENVFGGNNAGGYILGHIKLNIEERDCDTPIRIDHLYLGGNEAAYSMYGYYNAGTTESPNPQPRTAEMADPTDATHYKEVISTINGVAVRRQPDTTTQCYAQPELNVISCTYIGEVFGGGYGTGATLYGDPIVNINMVPGPKAATNITRNGGDNAHALGEIHDVFGGGNQAAVEGNTTVNIGTATTVTLTSVEDDPATEAHENVATVEGAYITGNVYGGGNEANVTGNTYVNVCAYKNDDNTTTDVIEYSGVTISGTDFEGVTIKGNVFGGGKGITEAAGVTGAFECAKAMVGVVDTNDGHTDITKESTDKGTRVSIGNGTIEGSVYGGGQIGRVEWNGVVTIGLPIGQNETSAPVIRGDVFGAGKGVEQYGYAALMRGNTFVTIQANAKIGKSVYGGGEIASVGKYSIVQPADINNSTFMAEHPGIEVGMPYSLANEQSGYCNVIVRGNAEIGPDNMKMYYANGDAPDDEGHVFGAGKGILPYENESTFECQASGHTGQRHPGRMSKGNVWECYNNQEAKYLRFIETQALATHTEVVIDGNAFVKGSVYGGSLSGHVQHDTHVTITGDCQIGAGFNISTNQSLAKYTNWPTDNITESWDACAHWNLDANDNAPYDPYAIYSKEVDGKVRYYYDAECTEANYANGGSHIAKNGQTYYGNVFGGGSGVVPYKPGLWHREAGSVGGNTVVDIISGHILTSVYGGNECTDVGTYDPSNRNLVAGTGKCTVNIIGGTIGVPRIKTAIEAHPMISCVYGGGKGDSRVNFNKWTNVGETEVNISKDARIYGSVFGGGEDGHVLGDAETNIGGSVTIGTTTHTYSNVIIGSQGQSGADGNVFGGGRGFSEDALTAGVVCGNVRLNIHNGKILGTVYGGGRLASVGTHLADYDNTALYGKLIPNGYNQVIGSTDVEATGATHGIININIDGGTIGATDAQGKLLTSDYSIGNVFGGCKGAGSDKRFGLAKKTTITMTGGTVNGNVYGGGELGYVGESTYHNDTKVYTWAEESADGGLCTIDISGTSTVAGHVFGAGKGLANDFECEKALVRTTSVTISAGTVSGNVYGGGEVGRVDQNTVVTIGAATGDSAPHITGSVFGAGAGVRTHGYSALVRGNTTVTVQNHATVGHSVYGGGEIASVGKYGLDGQKMPSILKGGGYCYVTVKGDAIITGDVFGAGQGITPNFDKDNADRSKRPRRMTMYNADDFPASAMLPANSGEASGTTEQGTTWEYYEPGSPYIWEYFREESGYLTYLETLALATHPEVTIEGNATIGEDVYGGGERGITKGSVIVNIKGGTITRDVYGGGALANTNTTTSVDLDGDDVIEIVNPTTTVNLHGGIIGHNVYGGGLGEKPSSTNTNGIAALVYGNVLVKLNETTATDNCVIKGVLHGANNYYGSPKGDVTVHVYKTQGWTDNNGTPDDTSDDISHDVTSLKGNVDSPRNNTTYELKAVYGGGNEATYDPTESTSVANVIIEGCALTSIETVYGGGNAASAPGTHVLVNSCFEIGTVFGGGNGKDALGDGTPNFGAHVGYKPADYTYDSSKTDEENLAAAAAAFEAQKTSLTYGTGEAWAELKGGTIHSAFGGSNTLGNVRTSATVTLNEPEGNTCPLCIEEVYGAGNNADQDGTSNIDMGCISYLSEIYGGAKNADVNSDVVLTIQSGRFDRVFGGNNLGGCVRGSITVNIEETGCHPIVIGQLFGGGNKAGYSIYGYKLVNGKWLPREATDGIESGSTAYADPQVNVKSFTSIGEVYGGGYGNSAVLVGNPYVYIDECMGSNATVDITGDWKDQNGVIVDANTKVSANTSKWIHFIADQANNITETVWQPEHKSGAIGTIGNVFGGGNAAAIHGNTNVIIGTKEYVEITSLAAGAALGTDTYYIRTGGAGTETSPYTYAAASGTAVAGTKYYKKVIGVTITGNVYGGGNAADVTGDTNVKIGTKE